MEKSKHRMIQHLVAQIEERLGWGSGTEWSNKDFEELSDLIFETTKKRLSVTTLKRIWGRAEMVANPSSATLDILSEYLGYKSWREFAKGTASKSAIASAKRKGFRFQLPAIILVLMGIAVVATLMGAMGTNRSVEGLDFMFKSRPVSDEIPNSVVFEYDASAANDLAKIEIQQSWDQSKRITINRRDSIATCIYYRPGFFKSKLVVDGTVVQENDVFIQTQGWLGIIERDSLPIYLKTAEIQYKNELSVTPGLLAQYGIDPRSSNVGASFYLVKDFGEVYTNDFELSMEIQNTFEQGVSGCQGTSMFLLYDGGAVGVQLAKKGCVSNLNLMAFGKTIDGKKNDLSGFGVDFDDFVTLQLVSKEGILQMLINGNQVYEMEVPKTPKQLKGITTHFEGAGALQNVLLKNTTAVFYDSAQTSLQ